jgi:hypothetical protein
VVHPLEEAIELFTARGEAELVVENWNRDEPDRAGELTSNRSNSRPRRTDVQARPAETLVRLAVKA